MASQTRLQRKKSRLSQSWRSDDDPSRTSGLQRKQRFAYRAYTAKESTRKPNGCSEKGTPAFCRRRVRKSYYYNSLTRQVTWNAPKLLGKLGRELSVADGIADETAEEKKSAEPVLEKRRRSIAHKWTTEEAALCIQGIYRKKKARENLMAAVKRVHQRFVDDESGKSYYYNSHAPGNVECTEAARKAGTRAFRRRWHRRRDRRGKSRLSQSWRSDDDPSRTSGLQRKQRFAYRAYTAKESTRKSNGCSKRYTSVL